MISTFLRGGVFVGGKTYGVYVVGYNGNNAAEQQDAKVRVNSSFL